MVTEGSRYNFHMLDFVLDIVFEVIGEVIFYPVTWLLARIYDRAALLIQR